MTKKNNCPDSPKISESDLFERWSSAPWFQWGDFGDRCSTCRVQFRTGDVTILFGSIDGPAIESRSCDCHRCGMTALMANKIPSGAAVYVEHRHRDRKIEELSRELKIRLVEGFAIIDAIDDGLRIAAERLQRIRAGESLEEAKKHEGQS